MNDYLKWHMRWAVEGEYFPSSSPFFTDGDTDFPDVVYMNNYPFFSVHIVSCEKFTLKITNLGSYKDKDNQFMSGYGYGNYGIANSSGEGSGTE